MIPEAKRKERFFKMMLAFKISFFSTEKGVNCFKFATTLSSAKKIVSDLEKSGKGKKCKITPIKLK